MRQSIGLILMVATVAACAHAATLPLGEGFENAAEGWKLGPGVTVAQEPGLAYAGTRYLRCENVKPAEASYGTLGEIAVKPNTGYVLRTWVRFDGGAQYTFGILNPNASFFVCRDMYGFGKQWEEIVVPFRTEQQTQVSIYAGRRYGTGAVLFDGIELVEDDSVKIGDVSPKPNPFPKLTAAEQARGYVTSPQSWMRPIYPTFYPARNEIGKPLECRLAPDEYEPVTLALTAARDLKGLEVKLAGDLKGPQGQKLPMSLVNLGVVRTITRWQTNSAPLKPGQRFERLPLLIYPNQPFDLKAQETGQVWATVQAPDGQRPGKYEGALLISTVGAAPLAVPLRVEVLPVKLAPAEPTYGIYYRHLEVPKEYQTEDFFKRCVADMKAHGMNSFCIYAWLERKNADGKWTVDLEQGGSALSLPNQMTRLQEAGLLEGKHPLMLLSMESASNGRLFTEDQVVRAAEELRRQRDWPEFLWYLVDEPGPSRFDMARQLTGFVHRVPGIRTTTAGVRDELAECYDVWIQSTPSRTSVEQVKEIAARGKEPWAYNCTWNGSQPANDRFFTGFHMWTTGLRGNWQWCYTEGQKGSSRLSDELKVPLPYYEEPWYVQYVLPAPEGNLPTLGWEGRREGIDDYRYLQTLRDAVAAAGKSGNKAKKQTAAQAQRFLTEVRTRTTRTQTPLPGTNSTQNYGFSMQPGLQFEDYDRIRRQAADYLIKLQH